MTSDAPEEADMAQVKVHGCGLKRLIHRYQLVSQQPEVVEVDQGVVSAVLSKLHPGHDLCVTQDDATMDKIQIQHERACCFCVVHGFTH